MHGTASLQSSESLPKVNMDCKQKGDYGRAVFTEESEARLSWLALMLYLSPHIEGYANQFQQVLALPL